jgi:hypothetical protein
LPPETFPHLFFECPGVQELRRNLVLRFFPVITDYNDHDKKLFWFCGILNNEKTNLALGIAILVINFYIWETKLKKTRISLAAMELDCIYTLDKCAQLSRKMRLNCDKINLPFFRRWQSGIVRDGGEQNREDEE